MTDTVVEERVRSRQSSRSGSRPAEWLPPLRAKLLLNQPLNMRFIKIHKPRDWFLSLSWAIGALPDPTQARMLAKAYLFLRDFHPSGLVGQLAHISGSDLMRYLLCHQYEHATSRHKLTKDAEVAFTELEKWMKLGRDWRQALTVAKDTDKHHKLPGLHSPAGMLALLVIAYPDMKFRDRIQRLQIEWMMKPRAEVTEGYWAGLDPTNLFEVFLPEQPRKAETKPLLDYSQILGNAFIRCRTDMRPFLPPWAQNIVLEGEPNLSDLKDPVEESGDGLGDPDMELRPSEGHALGSPAPRATPAEVSQLRKHLVLPSAQTKSSDELEEWLITNVMGGAEIYADWCDHWAGKMQMAESYEDQLIIRSLFLQSLYRLRNLRESAEFANLAEAYMILDQDEADAQLQSDDGKQRDPDDGRLVRQTPAHAAWVDANARFSLLVEEMSARKTDKAAASLARVQRHHNGLVGRLTSDPAKVNYASGVLMLDRLRAQVLIRDIESKAAGQALQDAQSGKEPLPADRVILADNPRLKLTVWQLRMLLGEAALRDVLTDAQQRLFHQLPLHDGLEFVNLAKVMPVSPHRLTTDTLDEVGNRILRWLFGSLEQPPNAGALPRPPIASPCTSHIAQSAQVQANAIQASTHAAATPAGSTAAPTKGSGRPAQNHKVHATAGSADRRDSAPLTSRFPSFAGKKYVPEKRQRSPDGSEDANKVPRLSDLTREDLRQDLQSELKTALTAELMADRERLKADLRADLAAELAADRERLADGLKAGFRKQLDADRADRAGVLDDLKSASDRAIEEARKAQQNIVQLQTDMRLMDAQLKETIKAGHEATAQSLDDRFNALKALLAKTPLLGEDGYLDQSCPAPQTWNQAAYKSTLLRAAWFYINQLGDPDGGVGEDQEAIEATAAKFPDIADEHLETAIRHVHMQAYHLPFP